MERLLIRLPHLCCDLLREGHVCVEHLMDDLLGGIHLLAPLLCVELAGSIERGVYGERMGGRGGEARDGETVGEQVRRGEDSVSRARERRVEEGAHLGSRRASQ